MKRSSDAKVVSPVSPHGATLFSYGCSKRKGRNRKGRKRKGKDRGKGLKDEEETGEGEGDGGEGRKQGEEAKKGKMERRSSFPTIPTMRIAQQIEV